MPARKILGWLGSLSSLRTQLISPPRRELVRLLHLEREAFLTERRPDQAPTGTQSCGLYPVVTSATERYEIVRVAPQRLIGAAFHYVVTVICPFPAIPASVMIALEDVAPDRGVVALEFALVIADPIHAAAL